jgi:hypothetical protein
MIARRVIAGESGRSITLREMQQNSLDGWRNFGAGLKTPVDDSKGDRAMVSADMRAAFVFGQFPSVRLSCSRYGRL